MASWSWSEMRCLQAMKEKKCTSPFIFTLQDRAILICFGKCDITNHSEAYIVGFDPPQRERQSRVISDETPHTHIYIYCPTRMQDKNVNIWFAKRINFYSQTVLLYALYTFRTRKCVIHHTKVKVIEMIWPHNKRECNTKWVLIWLHNERGNATRSELHGLFIIHMNLSIRVQILSLSYVLVINFYTSWYPHR